MKTFKATNKKNNEIINLLRLGARSNLKIPIIAEWCEQKVLLCSSCKEPVTLQYLDCQIWCFLCYSQKCNHLDFTDAKYLDEFQRKEDDFYNPDDFFDGDSF